MVTFVHTSDWQMGMKASQAGHAAGAVREARFESAKRVVELARERRADFILIAGDTFEDTNIDESVVRRTAGILNEAAPIPVFVIPGNHDPYMKGSVWDRPGWKGIGDHVSLLTVEEPVRLDGVAVLYPCPLRKKTGRSDPTAWIPERELEDPSIRIGVAHGSLQTERFEIGKDFLIPADRAERSGLDYLALGHWHSFFRSGRTVYSGSHEQTSFGETDAGNALVVSIDDHRTPPKVEKVRVGRLRWFERKPEIRDETDAEKLLKEVRDLGDPRKVLVRLRPRWSVPDTSIFERVRERLGGEYLFLSVSEPGFCLGDVGTVPEGLLSEVEQDLRTLLEGKIPEGPARAYATKPKEVIEEAYTLLRRLAREAAE